MASQAPVAGKAGSNFRSDFSSSLVVFLVALPLCMGIAVACGMPMAAGILTGIIGGLVVGILAGSPLQVSGPAAGLTVLVYQIVTDGNLGLPMLGVIVMGAGLVQLLAGSLRLGQWFRAVSPAVVEGMLAGIGILIFTSQFHVMVDDDPKGSGIANLVSLPAAVWKGIVPSESATHNEAARVGLLTILCLVLWKLFAPKRLKIVPAPLVGILVATTVTVILQRSGVWPALRPVVMPANLADEIRWPTLDALRRVVEVPVLIAVFSMAFIASAETMLCATAVDQLHAGPRTNYDRELGAQGVGNLLCGLVGALPMTGVIVRSAANVEAGARTRLSAILHGFWLLLLVALIPFVLELIPRASLAAVLVYTGYKLVNLTVVRKLGQYGWREVVIYVATAVVVVCMDLLTGVLLGVALSLLKLIWTFSRLRARLSVDPENGRATLRLEGSATFLRLPLLASKLAQVPPTAELHVDFENLLYIDHACLDLLEHWEKQHEAMGGSLVLDWVRLTSRFLLSPRMHPRAKLPSDGKEDRAAHHPSLLPVTTEKGAYEG